ncbi:hypothetical protein [Cupriavidus sp. H39]|uniref:hypothetical protein n=1 Tax=Cupriavidus sp. H39 TaxID=3401635 RepID=UPI003D062CEB
MIMFFNNGNLTGLSIILLLGFGLFFLYASVNWLESYPGRLASFSIGLMAVAAAGFAGRSKALGLRPLGESPWRKAKRTYSEDEKPKE